ncbi:unnamed protein product [Didymodactylos carnosus]|uniref:RRM domain-containing protein n=1 Tax=Didymodactylos carnosus TaxID=1234261 RepID=A0A8S2E9G7_9BILA|nr:unnamed protein product [Didymodactylos carnosus]CAF3865230.1 unnamed protein product [Didymodactylos carnosus]
MASPNSSTTSDEQFRKVFIGGLSYSTTDDTLRSYCEKFGDITDCVIMRDRSGTSRGFGFVTFRERSMVDDLMSQRPHLIDGRQTEPKRAMPRDEASRPEGQLTVKKIFIGGVKDEMDEEQLKNHFNQYGNIIDCSIMKDKDVDRIILDKPHSINGKELDVRKAIPREQTQRNSGIAMGMNDYYFRNGPFDARYPMNMPPPSMPYGCLPPSYALQMSGKPMPLMASNVGQQGPPPFSSVILPPELANSAFFRRQPTSSTNQQNGGKKSISGDDSSYMPYDYFQMNPMGRGGATAMNNRMNNRSRYFSGYRNGRQRPRSNRRSNSNNDPNSEQHRKLFIGGLSYKTTDDSLKSYVEKFGQINDCVVMKDKNNLSRGFGFVTYADVSMIDDFMAQRPHNLDGRQIDPKRAMPREEAMNDDVHLTVKKIFIGGIRDGITEDTLKEYFDKYGKICDCFIMKDKTGNTRGFGFLEFDDYDSVDRIILDRPHTIDQRRIDVKKAVPKEQRQLQQQQAQALQLQAAAAYHYHYGAFGGLSGGDMLSGPVMRTNGIGVDNPMYDDVFGSFAGLNGSAMYTSNVPNSGGRFDGQPPRNNRNNTNMNVNNNNNNNNNSSRERRQNRQSRDSQ